MGLRAYVEDKALIKALVPYGDIKGEVIRLKYKADHDLAGLENGNRLVRMILNKPSIHYSLKIGNEWCRIIHNNQQPICRECTQLGDSSRKCPTVTCNLCEQVGHMSMDCPQRFTFPPCPESEVTPDETPITSTEMEHDLNPVQPPPDQQLSTETTLPAIDATITSETQNTASNTDFPSFTESLDRPCTVRAAPRLSSCAAQDSKALNFWTS